MCSDAAWGGHGRIWVCLGKVHDQGPLHQLDCFAQSGITVTMLRWSAAIVQAQMYNDLKGGEVLAALGHDFPKLEIKRPTFYSGSNDVASSNVAAVQLSATGVSVSPCAIPVSPVGASINPTVSCCSLLQHPLNFRAPMLPLQVRLSSFLGAV